MKFKTLLLASTLCFANATFAQSIEKPVSKDLSISIYNNDLALIRDVRSVDFKQGLNTVAFEGVASSIKPASVMITGERIRVLEQNYDFALLTPHNIIEKSVGQIVKTVRINPATGKREFDQAKLIAFQEGEPVLLFDYGVEPHFEGQIVVEKLPEDLSQKPTLAAKISSLQSEAKDITLAYLTNGISWKTNYVAGIKDDKTLDLTGWVSITNNSGVSYDNAQVQLIAGVVNQVFEYTAAPRYAAKSMAFESNSYMVSDSVALGVEQESFSAYQLYTLPNRTSIQNNQTKQMALIEQMGVKYEKEGRLHSNLYLSGDHGSSFKKAHPKMYYIIKNEKESNLGIPLPQGTVRFYENDSKENLQFIGENSIKQTAKGEKLELQLGEMFDVFVNGKSADARKVSDTIITASNDRCPRYKVIKVYDSEVIFHNGGDKEAVVVFQQYLNTPNTKFLKENMEGSFSKENPSLYEWRIELKADEEKTLTFTAEVTQEEQRCH